MTPLNNPHNTAYFKSPLGWMKLQASASTLTGLVFVDAPKPVLASATKVLAETQRQLAEWFAGKRTAFELPLAPEGTAFQQKVWNELATIPFGSTCSYLDIALALGDKNATRAVGAANGKNPLAIVLPCHRVIGSNGKLTGYAGGMERKRWLLHFEQQATQPTLFSSI